jgi:DNA-binding winged helix-turn-helix (wHTH) protein/tetratricopeptide (TPR) repeat protein
MLTRTSETRNPINLAHVAPFRIGELEIQPATRQLFRNGRAETLEPRVMQVLVALAQAEGGGVVTRDELTDLCWDGRIVSENAINRVISRIRQLASDIGAGSFQLETITKVGYRIMVPDSPRGPQTAVPETPPDAAENGKGQWDGRRRFIAAGLGAALLAGGGGLLVWHRSRRHEPTPEARELFRRGTLAQREGIPDQVRQAVSFFEQAVATDPLYAEAWGALALSYRHILEGFAASEQQSLPDRIRSAAGRALALDPDNADAQLALAIIEPYFRNWARMERDLRRIVDRHPDHWLAQAQLGLLLQDVGRTKEGILHSQRVIEIDPFLPVAHAFLIRAFSMARRIQEADAASRRALERWPSHPFIWGVRFNMLLFSDRPGSAAAFISDPEHRPENMDSDAVSMRLRLARAVESRRPEDVAQTLAAYHTMALADIQSIPIAKSVFALLGRPDLAFSSLERYFFGTGSFGDAVAPPGRYDRRYTIALSAPPLIPYREDPRYAHLLRRVGLESYWQETGTRPDHRATRESSAFHHRFITSA